jgi:glycosyltransferase involved in cell wall biosynthesis
VHDLAHLALPGIFNPAKRLYSWLFFHRIAKTADEILLVSKFTRSEFLRFNRNPRGNCTVIYNGVDRFWFDLSSCETQTNLRKFFLVVGNVKPHKNVPLICRAFATIAEQCDADLHIVGKHSGFKTSEIAQEKMERLCPGRIIFSGKISLPLLCNCMRNAIALVLPSLYEGFGLPVLEAMAAGLPVIASDIPAIRDLHEEKVALCPPDNEEAFAAAMLNACQLSHEARAIISSENRAHAASFTWERCADRTVAVLRRLLRQA